MGRPPSGKSELAAEVAQSLGAEIVSADAFQIYRGLDLLTAKPDQATLAKAPHHLIGAVPLNEEMNVEKYRAMAEETIRIFTRAGNRCIVVGGSGLYVRRSRMGWQSCRQANRKLREALEEATIEELFRSLSALDPAGAQADRPPEQTTPDPGG